MLEQSPGEEACSNLERSIDYSAQGGGKVCKGGGGGATPYRGRGGKKGIILKGVKQASDVELGPYFFVVPKNKLAGTDLCTPYCRACM